MGRRESEIRRPKRWDTPFGDAMTDQLVDVLLSIPPFSNMDATRFPTAIPLREILQNDARVVDFQSGDVIIREGDYGHSAFMILEGSVDVCLHGLPDQISAKVDNGHRVKKKGWVQSLKRIWNNPRIAEVRDGSQIGPGSGLGTRTNERGDTRIFLQDVPQLLNSDGRATMQNGEIFGEMAALSRTPRTATIVATEEKTRLLEIRWQGLRDLIRRDSSLREHIEQLYRENNLKVHLRETPLLETLSIQAIDRVARYVNFETFGQFDWQQKYRSSIDESGQQVLRSEPVIVKQGDYPDGVILIRNGFARVSRKHGSGEQTVSYLGKGDTFGFNELAHNWRSSKAVGWEYSLRAIGYVDILRIPTAVVEQEILPKIDNLPELIQPAKTEDNQTGSDNDSIGTRAAKVAAENPGSDSELETSMLEFLVEHRFINGTQSMMIDMDRCTRCDDCVRACASTHNNNPRFVRQGPIHDGKMIANSCMHCVDPVCMIGCPTGAIGRDAATGNITIQESTCIGCATCANSCPYDNIRMVELQDRRGNLILDSESSLPIVKATKCDLCSDQLTGPACQNACPHDALVRIDMSDATTLAGFLNR